MGASLVTWTVKNLPAIQETQVQFLGREDSLEKEMATCLENPVDRGAWQATVHGVTVWHTLTRCIYVSPDLPIYPLSYSLVTIHLFSTLVPLLLFHK